MQTKEILGTKRLRVRMAIEKKKIYSYNFMFNSARYFFVSCKSKFCPSFKGKMLKLRYSSSARQNYCHSMSHTVSEPASLNQLPVWVLRWKCEKEGGNASAFLPRCLKAMGKKSPFSFLSDFSCLPLVASSAPAGRWLLVSQGLKLYPLKKEIKS